MQAYIAVYGYTYPYVQHVGAIKVPKTPSQRIHTQEVGVSYTKLTQLWCNATKIPLKAVAPA